MTSANVRPWTGASPPWPALGGRAAGAAPALHRLAAALDGEPPPCAEDPARWFSSEPAEIEAAEVTCRTCPGVAACDALAEANGERWGTWGGADRSPAATRRRASAARHRAASSPTPPARTTDPEAS